MHVSGLQSVLANSLKDQRTESSDLSGHEWCRLGSTRYDSSPSIPLRASLDHRRPYLPQLTWITEREPMPSSCRPKPYRSYGIGNPHLSRSDFVTHYVLSTIGTPVRCVPSQRTHTVSAVVKSSGRC